MSFLFMCDGQYLKDVMAELTENKRTKPLNELKSWVNMGAQVGRQQVLFRDSHSFCLGLALNAFVLLYCVIMW